MVWVHPLGMLHTALGFDATASAEKVSAAQCSVTMHTLLMCCAIPALQEQLQRLQLQQQ